MQMDSIWKAFFWVGVFFLVTAGIMFSSSFDGGENEPLRWYSIPVAFVGIMFFVACFMTPSTKTLAAMYTVPAVVNSEKAQKIGNESIEVLELGLERLKEVLEGEKK